jgi:hypothetical protein
MTVQAPIVGFLYSSSSRDVLNPVLLAQTLLDYLGSKNISATFFVVGSRVVERPNVLREEYMRGHEISVHTWSHKVNPICLLVFFFCSNLSHILIAAYFFDY